MQSLNYKIDSKAELGLSYIPFIKNGGIFVKGHQTLKMGQVLNLQLQMPDGLPEIVAEVKVVWLTPVHAMHHALAGAGLQFVGENAKSIKSTIEDHIEKDDSVGGYAYGMLGGEGE